MLRCRCCLCCAPIRRQISDENGFEGATNQSIGEPTDGTEEIEENAVYAAYTHCNTHSSPKYGAVVQLTTHLRSLPISQILLVCYGLFFLGYFFVPKSFESDHYKLYYIVITIITIPLIPQAFRLVNRDNLFFLCLFYISYMLASVTWSDAFFEEPTPWRGVYDHLKHGAQLLIFILGTRVLMQTHPRQYEQMRHILFFAAGLAGMLTMLYWYSAHSFPDTRVVGFSLTENPNDLAFVYGAVCTWGFAFFISKQGLVSRLPYLVVLTALVLLLFLTQSRGALVAITCATGVFGLRRQGIKGILLVVAMLGSVMVTVVLIEPRIADEMIARGDSTRIALWSDIIKETLHRPLMGSGYLSNAVIEIGTHRLNAHSAYFATFRDGGLVGLTLLIGMLTLACKRAYGIGNQTGDYTWLAALVFAMVFLITAGDRLIDRPKEVWFAFWLPIAMIIAFSSGTSLATQRENVA